MSIDALAPPVTRNFLVRWHPAGFPRQRLSTLIALDPETANPDAVRAAIGEQYAITADSVVALTIEVRL
jgi:hypothetical protein